MVKAKCWFDLCGRSSRPNIFVRSSSGERRARRSWRRLLRAVLRGGFPRRSWCITSQGYLRGRTASPEVGCPQRPVPPAEHFCALSSGERHPRRSWRRLLGLSSGEASLAGAGASLPRVTSGDARLRRRWGALSGRSRRPNIHPSNRNHQSQKGKNSDEATARRSSCL